MNLSAELERWLAPAASELVARVSAASAQRGYGACLVGGAVRDLLLGRASPDIDIIIEGDAEQVARDCAQPSDPPPVFHRAFGTATISSGTQRIDLATARAESYRQPGALPDVWPGSIEDDLVRRDFTTNAMALVLGGEHHGDLIDPHGGRLDLEHGLLRILHEQSFVDDATRIFRGVRYEQRFGFVFEDETKRLLFRDVERVRDISGDRVRHEFDRIMEEIEPEPALRRLDGVGVLEVVAQGLRFDAKQADACARARVYGLSAERLLETLWCVLAWRLAASGVGELVTRLNLPRRLATPVGDCERLHEAEERLDEDGLAPSSVYALLHHVSPAALNAASLLLDGAVARKHVHAYLTKLRHVRPALTGEALREMGFASGPEIGRVLELLRDARLDGLLNSRTEEVVLAQAVFGPGSGD